MAMSMSAVLKRISKLFGSAQEGVGTAGKSVRAIRRFVVAD
jgi:hypothetical protein